MVCTGRTLNDVVFWHMPTDFLPAREMAEHLLHQQMPKNHIIDGPPCRHCLQKTRILHKICGLDLYVILVKKMAESSYLMLSPALL